MNIQTIDHLEFYVGDARQTAFYLCTAFGFRVRARSGPQAGRAEAHSILLEHGDIRIVLTSGLVAEHPAARYVARHGDGVAIVALSTDDVATAYEEVVDKGATGLSGPTRHGRDGDEVITATVSGFGDVTHRLVQRGGTSFLPGVFEHLADDPERGDDLLTHIDHLAVCLPAGALSATSRFYQDAFGFAEIFEEYIEVGKQGMDSKVVQSPSREVTFTLIEPDPRRDHGQIDDFLDWHDGAGVQHIAFATTDIIAAVRIFGSRGVGFAATPPTYYDHLEQRLGHIERPIADLRELGVLVDSDHWGQMFQIFTQSMHVRRTLFLELIERRGALTFGSSNIKALYEAKERELAGVTERTLAGDNRRELAGAT